MKKLILLIAALVIVIGSAGIFFKKEATKNPSATTTVLMQDEGFNPAEIKIKKVDRVTFKNVGTRAHWPASNLHPTHGIYHEFDPKQAIAPGEEWSFVFDKAGSWKYHDHLFPSLRGVIIVNH